MAKAKLPRDPEVFAHEFELLGASAMAKNV